MKAVMRQLQRRDHLRAPRGAAERERHPGRQQLTREVGRRACSRWRNRCLTTTFLRTTPPASVLVKLMLGCHSERSPLSKVDVQSTAACAAPEMASALRPAIEARTRT
jgi:hypothetical protein